MRAQLLVVVLVTGATGFAGAAVPLLAPSDVDPLAALSEPVLVLDEIPLVGPVLSLTGQAVGLVDPASSLTGRDVIRVDRLPRHILLPDGALIASHESLDAGVLTREGVLVRGGASAPPHAILPEPRLAREPQLERFETPTLPGEAAFSTPYSPAPEPVAVETARVFEPQTSSEGSATVIWFGGIAFIGASLVGFALYHRIRPNAALENETRKTIFDAVCGQPGLGVHEISRMAGVSYSTATYHLERLVGAGMIVMTPDGNKLCYYKNGGAFTESERRILPLLKNEEAAKLFEAILQAPGTYRAALAEQLGVTATTINWHLRRLRDAGLVDEIRQGRSAHLYARVEALRPAFLQLATKVDGTDPPVAEKLRRYAVPADTTGGVGAA